MKRRPRVSERTDILVPNTTLVRSPGERCDRRTIGNSGNLTSTALACVAGLTDGKGGVERSRLTELVAEVEMINWSRTVVEHRLLDEPLTEGDRKSTRLKPSH